MIHQTSSIALMQFRLGLVAFCLASKKSENQSRLEEEEAGSKELEWTSFAFSFSSHAADVQELASERFSLESSVLVSAFALELSSWVHAAGQQLDQSLLLRSHRHSCLHTKILHH